MINLRNLVVINSTFKNLSFEYIVKPPKNILEGFYSSRSENQISVFNKELFDNYKTYHENKNYDIVGVFESYLSGYEVYYVEFINSYIKESSFYRINFLLTVFQKIVFKDLNFNYVKFDTCYMKDCEFINCVFYRSAFDKVKFENVKFTNCIIKNSTFNECDIYISFDNTTLNGLYVQNSKIPDNSIFKNQKDICIHWCTDDDNNPITQRNFE